MTQEQPEALRLADELDVAHAGHSDEGPSSFSESAAELRRLHAENEALRRDANCFRFWVREAAVNPCDMAKLIMRCTTEQEYRDAIEPLATAADDAIRAAMKGQS